MFFNSELKQWCIFWRVSPKYASCRLKTPRGPHMASGETWSVWNNEKKKFVKSTEMVCRLLTPDELVALAPDTIMMNAEQLGHCWHEAPGAIASHRRDAAGLVNECFKKIDEMKNGRPVYQSWREKNQRPVLTADPVALFQTNSVVTFFFKGSERVWKGWILPQVQWSIFDLSVKKEDLDSDVLCKRGRHISAECAHGLLFPSGGSLGGQRDNQVSPYITTRVG